MSVEEDSGVLIFQCPHCQEFIQVNKSEVNCAIFRHAFHYDFNKNRLLNQVNPHLPKAECDKLIENKKIVGCGKPFKIVLKEKKVEICDYI